MSTVRAPVSLWTVPGVEHETAPGMRADTCPTGQF